MQKLSTCTALVVILLLQLAVHSYASELDQYLLKGDYNSARKEAERLVKSVASTGQWGNPEEAEKVSHAAEFYTIIGDYDKAEFLFDRIFPDQRLFGAVVPGSTALAERKAFFLLESGKYKSAEKYILFAEKNSHSPRSILLWVRYKGLMAEYQEAEGLLDELDGQPLTDALRSDLLFEKAQIFSLPGKHEEADALLKECLELREKLYPENHLLIADALQSLACNDLWRDKHDDAFQEVEDAIRIKETILPESHKDLLLAYGIKGEALRRLGKYQEAMELLEKALSGLEKIFGQYHPEHGMTSFWLGKVYLDREEYDKGFKYMQQGLDSYEKYFGLKHLQTMVSLGNFATECLNLGFDRKAEQLYSRTVVLDLEAYPKEASLSSMFYNLATLYKDGDHYQEAESLFLRVLKMRERDDGPNHFRVANVLVQLAELYYEEGQYENVENYLLRARQIYEEVYGSEHEKVSLVYNDLANYYSDTDQQERAEEYYKKSIELDEKLFSPGSPKIERTLENLAELYDDMGREEDANKIRKRLLMIQTHTTESEDEGVVDIMKSLSEHYRSIAKNEEADQLYEKILTAMKHSVDIRNPGRTLICLRNLALMHKALGQFEDTEFILDLLLENGSSLLINNPRIHILLVLDRADILYLERRNQEWLSYQRQVVQELEALVAKVFQKMQGVELADLLGKGQFAKVERVLRKELSIENIVTGKDNASGKNELVLPVSKTRTLATAALILSANDWSLTVLPDKNDIRQRKEMQESLNDSWDITTRKKALETLQWLKSKGSQDRYQKTKLKVEEWKKRTFRGDQLLSKNTGFSDKLPFLEKYQDDVARDGLYAWDMCRYVAVCLWSYAADYISEKELWDLATPVARDIQGKYFSWDELGFYYLVGRQYWLSTDPDDHLEHAIQYLNLLNDSGSVWRQIPWEDNASIPEFASIINRRRKGVK